LIPASSGLNYSEEKPGRRADAVVAAKRNKSLKKNHFHQKLFSLLVRKFFFIRSWNFLKVQSEHRLAFNKLLLIIIWTEVPYLNKDKQ